MERGIELALGEMRYDRRDHSDDAPALLEGERCGEIREPKSGSFVPALDCPSWSLREGRRKHIGERRRSRPILDALPHATAASPESRQVRKQSRVGEA
jgi:hypothetical protein